MNTIQALQRFHLSEVSPLWQSLETHCLQGQLSVMSQFVGARGKQVRPGSKAFRSRRWPMFLKSNLLWSLASL